MRVVVRNSLSLNLLERLIQDITGATELLIKAADSIADYVSTSGEHTDVENRERIHKLLAAIASGGVAEVKRKTQKDNHQGSKNKSPIVVLVRD